MSTYVISDIHGCFDEFQEMIEKISLSEDDRLILAGDYIDRGKKSLEMLKWLENCPANILTLAGNHDLEFAGYVRLMEQIDESCELNTDRHSNDDAQILLETIRYMLKMRASGALEFFDYYGTVTDLIMNRGVSLDDLCRWAEMMEKLPIIERFECSGRDCIVVHAGYCEEEVLQKSKYDRLEDFCIYAREEGMEIGGIRNGMIIAGHTPTIAQDSAFFNDGEVFRYYDEKKDCIFYNIDCGCAYYEMYPSATLACMRVEDEEIFYL